LLGKKLFDAKLPVCFHGFLKKNEIVSLDPFA